MAGDRCDKCKFNHNFLGIPGIQHSPGIYLAQRACPTDFIHIGKTRYFLDGKPDDKKR